MTPWLVRIVEQENHKVDTEINHDIVLHEGILVDTDNYATHITEFPDPKSKALLYTRFAKKFSSMGYIVVLVKRPTAMQNYLPYPDTDSEIVIFSVAWQTFIIQSLYKFELSCSFY